MMGSGTDSTAVHADLLDSTMAVESRVTIVGLCRDEWPSLEKVRLDALHDAPSAFVTTVETESNRSADQWEAQFDRAEWVLVWDGGDVVGIAALKEPEPGEPPNCRFVESVWVEPDHRRRGVLRQIITDLEQRAIEVGATELRLWVLDSNKSAAWAYRRLGFEPVTQEAQETTKRWPDGTFVKERLMSKQLLVP